MINRCPSSAENDGRGRIHVTQNIDDGVFRISWGTGQRAIFNVAVLMFFTCSSDTDCILLIAFSESGNGLGHSSRKHQGSSVFRRGLQDEFQVLSKAEIKHLVRLIQNNHLDPRQIKRATLNMVTKPPRRTYDDMRPTFQSSSLGSHIHTTNAGGHAGVRELIEPF